MKTTVNLIKKDGTIINNVEVFINNYLPMYNLATLWCVKHKVCFYNFRDKANKAIKIGRSGKTAFFTMDNGDVYSTILNCI